MLGSKEDELADGDFVKMADVAMGAMAFQRKGNFVAVGDGNGSAAPAKAGVVSLATGSAACCILQGALSRGLSFDGSDSNGSGSDSDGKKQTNAEDRWW